MSVIITSGRTEGMVDASAVNYQESKIFRAIQNAQALEYDGVGAVTEDVDLQLSPITATWGLSYWEVALGIVPNQTGDYELRRPPILTKLLNAQNVGVTTIRELVRNYGEEVAVVVDHTHCLITITFQKGIPPFLNEFREALENLVHAHLGVDYKFMYRSTGSLYVGARHTLAPSLLIHPYLLGNYSTHCAVRTAATLKTASIIIVRERSV